MLFNAVLQEQDAQRTPVVMPVPTPPDAVPNDEEQIKAENRRQIYERIAQGHAMAEAENHARSKSSGG